MSARSSINDAQLQDMLDAARRLLDDFGEGVRLEPDVNPKKRGLNASGLLARARRGTKDGYPTSSLGGGGGAGGVSDRVGELVTEGWSEHGACRGEGCDDCSDGFTQRREIDPVRAAAVRFARHLRRALDELGAANGELYNISAGIIVPPDATDMWCRVHLRHGMWEPVGAGGRDGRCQWCYGFNLAERQDPPRALLELRAQGKRITSKTIADHLPRRRPNKRRKAS